VLPNVSGRQFVLRGSTIDRVQIALPARHATELLVQPKRT
jgi:hypothetical protein